MSRTKAESQKSLDDGLAYHRLPSHQPDAASRLKRCFARMDGRDFYVNVPEIREWIFSGFQYPEQIDAFLSGTGPVPNMRHAFRYAADRDFLSGLIGELRTTAHECLPTHPPMPNDPANAFRGVESLWRPETYTAPPIVKHTADNIGGTHPIVMSQMTTFIHEPEFSGDCCYLVFSRLPLNGPWDEMTVQGALDWAKENLNPMQGSEFRVFLHQLPEHGENIQFRGGVINLAGQPGLTRTTFDQFCCSRPSFIDHSLIDASNQQCKGEGINDDARTGDAFSKYLQAQFDVARENPKEGRLHDIDSAHLHHTLRRMRAALHPYRPPFFYEYQGRVDFH